MNKKARLIKEVNDNIEKTKELVNEDYHRLKYHIMPPTGLLNDPNGFIHVDGTYHLFYQFHPFDTSHGLKFWGHVKSPDLVRWKSLPIALTPDQWYETHGCYSGSAVNKGGALTLIYTGNVKDEAGNRETYQCLAISDDGVNFKKYKNNPVIHNQPQGYTRHFRDPKVWKKGGSWYMVIGAQTIRREGRALLFTSPNLKGWSLVGEVAGSNLNNLKDFGYMWECPDIFEMDDRDILIFCPQGLEAQGDFYNNIYQAGYFVGKLNYNNGKLDHGEFTELDRGFEFYAPQTTIDEKGRRLLIAWMGIPEREDHPTTRYGWIHAMTLPRVLELKNNKIYQNPVAELRTLRKNQIEYSGIEIRDEEIELKNIYGDVFELLIEIEVIDAVEFGIKLRCSRDGTEETGVIYNRKTRKLELNRNNSGKGYGGVRRCSLSSDLQLKLNIFSDTSSLEMFINNGEEVFTSRIYPDKISKAIKFFAKGGGIRIKNLKKWDL